MYLQIAVKAQQSLERDYTKDGGFLMSWENEKST